MSIKRSKQKSFGAGRRDENEGLFSFSKPPEPEKSWEEHMAEKPEEAFASYSFKQHYDKGALIQHPKFGKGVVLGIEGSHVDVLFAEGPKKLGHAVK